jgi:hypothetical protein
VASVAVLLLLVCGATNRARAASKPTPVSNEVRAQAKAAVAQAQIDYKLGKFQEERPLISRL